jgi:GNAT superfamily N-acetyltransferase
MLNIRLATDPDKPAIWQIIKAVISGGDTYVYPPDSGESEMLEYWFSPEKHTYAAETDDKIVATFWLKPNQPGLGSHVANAAYMVSPDAHGQGIGREIAEWSLDEARRLGFTAMQFNFVVKSNEFAVRLWQKIGFEIMGEIPDAFQNAKFGLTNAYIMYRRL